MFPSPIGRAALAALVAAATAVVSAAPQDGKFSVAVLRRDGLMIPFASHNGSRWTVPWPVAGTAVPLPISLSDVPKQWWGDVSPEAPWTAWLPEDVKRPLKLLKPAQVPIFCDAHLAIATDYHGAAPAEREPTVPKDALATAGDVTLLAVTQVSVNAPDAARLIRGITAKFNEEEELASKHEFSNWSHPYGPALRAQRPIELEAFYRATDVGKSGPFRTSYVEAVRRYPALPGDEGCGLVTFARGWITEFEDRKPIINLGVRITYCDRAEVQFFQPFGRIVIPATKSVFWVFQLSSWRNEFYSVSSVTAEGVKPVVAVAGGGCPKEPAH